MKASHSIATEFRQRIASGELKAGDPLPVESELVDRLGASRSVVREALRILETEGLVETRRGLGGGPRVRHPSISQVARGMGVYLQIGDVPVLDAWTARDRIIGAAVERMAGERSEAIADELGGAVHELDELVGDFDAYYPQLIAVSEAAVRLAGNATEHVLVAALRHVIAAELDAATRTVAVIDVDQAIDAERFITRAWQDVVRHIRGGRPRAARQAYDRQAELIRNGIAARARGATVVDAFGAGGHPGADPASRWAARSTPSTML